MDLCNAMGGWYPLRGTDYFARHRHLKHPSVTDQPYDVSGSVEYRCAMRADFEMRFHSFTQLARISSSR